MRETYKCNVHGVVMHIFRICLVKKWMWMCQGVQNAECTMDIRVCILNVQFKHEKTASKHVPFRSICVSVGA